MRLVTKFVYNSKIIDLSYIEASEIFLYIYKGQYYGLGFRGTDYDFLAVVEIDEARRIIRHSVMSQGMDLPNLVLMNTDEAEPLIENFLKLRQGKAKKDNTVVKLSKDTSMFNHFDDFKKYVDDYLSK